MTRRTSALAFAATLAAGGAGAGTADQCIDAADAGQAARDAGKFLDAQKHFRTCAKDGCPGELRRDCAEWLAAVQKRTPSIVVRARDAEGAEVGDAVLSVDGVRTDGRLAVDVDPGEHRVTAERNGERGELVVRLVEGERGRIVEVSVGHPKAKPPPAPPPAAPSARSGPPLGAWILGGVAVAALGGYAYFGLRGKGEADDMRKTCAPRCDAGRVDDAKRDVTIANVLFGVGVATGVTAVVLTVREKPETTAARLRLVAGPGAVRLDGAF